MSECQSVDGEWGQPCPACGQVLPNPGPIVSWKSRRPLAFASGSSAGLGERAAYASRRNPLTERQEEVLRIVAKHGGNRSAAARELECTQANVITMLGRAAKAGIKVPPPSTYQQRRTATA